MLRLAVVGLGKMGVSHFALANAHPDVRVAAVCDSTDYLLDVLRKYTGATVYSDYGRMLEQADLDAVVIATPTRFHSAMVEQALRKGLHVFCEKPLCLDPEEAVRLGRLADGAGLVNQVGYHNRFVGAFRELKRLVDVGAAGKVTHVLAEAYGPVVLKPRGSTWRSSRNDGGGCLYDYAAHPINLLNWCFGAPTAATGSVLNRIFSRDTEDEVLSTLQFPGDVTAQLSVNWSDASHRKMTTRITVWGTNGRLYADRQECQAYLRDPTLAPDGYGTGWNVRYTTDLTEPVWFYIRGEEYSAQLDSFIGDALAGRAPTENGFASAAQTDGSIAMILADAQGQSSALASPAPRRFSLFRS